MAILEAKYKPAPGRYGLLTIDVTGRCTEDEVADIAAGCTRRFVLEPIPNAAGAILKALDGTTPWIVEITPPTIGLTYDCVKVEGFCAPHAYMQVGGPYDGKFILHYLKRYQQVGGVA